MAPGIVFCSVLGYDPTVPILGDGLALGNVGRGIDAEATTVRR